MAGLDDYLKVEKPNDLEIDKPIRAKIVRVDATEREIKTKRGPVNATYLNLRVRTLAYLDDNGNWVDRKADKLFTMSYKKSRRKNSKYGVLLGALWKLIPDVMSGAESYKVLEGMIFEFEHKEIRIGNINTIVWVPRKFIGMEEVTDEERKMLDELDAPREQSTNDVNEDAYEGVF